MSSIDHPRLVDFGERRIIEEILRPRYEAQGVNHFGEDCAFVTGSFDRTGTIVATTDPCPEPMAYVLGFSDLYYRGWLLATINLSDLAAEGARPLGLLTSLTLPNETTIEQFVRLLDGIDDCCKLSETCVVGGNLKEGRRIELTGTAIGLCEKDRFLLRSGCRPGDLIVVVGDLGLFWAGVLGLQNDRITQQMRRNYFEMFLLRFRKYVLAKNSRKDAFLPPA